MLKRYIVEIGTGMDMHGGDVTNAAQKAVKDAVSHSCLCGLFDIIGLTDPNQMHVEVKVACPYRKDSITRKSSRQFPLAPKLEAVQGGLSVRGLHVPDLGEGDTIVVAVAALTVYVEVGIEPVGLSWSA